MSRRLIKIADLIARTGIAESDFLVEHLRGDAPRVTLIGGTPYVDALESEQWTNRIRARAELARNGIPPGLLET